MKRAYFLNLTCLLLLALVGHQEAKAQMKTESVLSIGVFVYPGMELQDFAGPMEVFVKAQEATFGHYEVYTIGLTDSLLYTDADAVSLKPAYTIQNFPKTDILIIPGTGLDAIRLLSKDASFINAIRTLSENATLTMTVSTGSYLLAATGLLNSLPATTHSFLFDDFQQQYPAIQVLRTCRFVESGKYLTTSGVTYGIDAALHLVEKHSGGKVASLISEAIQYKPGESCAQSATGKRSKKHRVRE